MRPRSLHFQRPRTRPLRLRLTAASRPLRGHTRLWQASEVDGALQQRLRLREGVAVGPSDIPHDLIDSSLAKDRCVNNAAVAETAQGPPAGPVLLEGS